jgi:hypothetical protein
MSARFIDMSDGAVVAKVEFSRLLTDAEADSE